MTAWLGAILAYCFFGAALSATVYLVLNASEFGRSVLQRELFDLPIWERRPKLALFATALICVFAWPWLLWHDSDSGRKG